MKKYICIENNGEIDPKSLYLIGGSTKRDDASKLGKFGSGNKFSIAKLLRDGIDFKIFTGNKQIEITTQKVNFRETSLDQIVVDNHLTSITTEMGPDWETNFIIREFIQNAIDESGYQLIDNVDTFRGIEGKTRVYIERNEKVAEVMNNFNTYFSFDREDVIVDTPEGKIFYNNDKNQNLILFTKGIKCYESKIPSLFHYDLDFEINESRVIKSEWDSSYKICEFLLKHGTEKVIHQLLTKSFNINNPVHESHFPWNLYFTNRFNDEWVKLLTSRNLILNTVSGLFVREQEEGYYLVNENLAKLINRLLPDIRIFGYDPEQKISFIKSEPTNKESYLLKDVLKTLEELGINITYEIEIGDFTKKEVLGQALKNKILLSKNLFNKGKREIALTIIEEKAHLDTNYSDCTREFQNYLLSLYLEEKENNNGIFF